MKPENAMGGARSGYVKIVDFGTAKYFEQVAAGGNQELKTCQDSDTKDLMFTINYASVETLAASAGDGHTPYNPFANDVHCIGAMLYVMFSGAMFPANPTDEAIQASLERIPHFKCHKCANYELSARSLIEGMTAKESERLTINEVLQHPWMTTPCADEEDLPEDVFANLIKLTRAIKIDGKPGDYLVQEVGTTSTHIVPAGHMGAIYDLSNPVSIDSLTAEQKVIFRKWAPALERGMMLYQAKEIRDMIVITDGTLKGLKRNWSKLKTTSAAGTEMVEVEDEEQIPRNPDVFNFVVSKPFDTIE